MCRVYKEKLSRTQEHSQHLFAENVFPNFRFKLYRVTSLLRLRMTGALSMTLSVLISCKENVVLTHLLATKGLGL
jgi:hypothetical protein